MLVTLKEVLKDAQKQKYAVGLFNTVILEMAKGVLAAAEELNSPVIIGTAEVLLPYSTLSHTLPRKSSIPCTLGTVPAILILHAHNSGRKKPTFLPSPYSISLYILKNYQLLLLPVPSLYTFGKERACRSRLFYFS